MDRTRKIIETCIDDVMSGHKTVADCLAAYPQYRSQLTDIFRLLPYLQAAQGFMPSEGFKQVALKHFIAHSQNSPARDRVNAPWKPAFSGIRQIVWISAVLVVACLVLLSVGVAFASSRAIPGDNLYPAKLGIEQIQIMFSGSQEREAELLITFACRRLDEVARLIEIDRPDQLGPSITAYQNKLAATMDILSNKNLANTDSNYKLISKAYLLVARNEALLDQLLTRVPANSQSAIQSARRLSLQNRVIIAHILLNYSLLHPTPGVINSTELATLTNILATVGIPSGEITDWSVIYPTLTEFSTIYPATRTIQSPVYWPTDVAWPTHWQTSVVRTPGEYVEWTEIVEWTSLPTRRNNLSTLIPGKPVKPVRTPRPTSWLKIPTPTPGP